MPRLLSAGTARGFCFARLCSLLLPLYTHTRTIANTSCIFLLIHATLSHANVERVVSCYCATFVNFNLCVCVCVPFFPFQLNQHRVDMLENSPGGNADLVQATQLYHAVRTRRVHTNGVFAKEHKNFLEIDGKRVLETTMLSKQEKAFIVAEQGARKAQRALPAANAPVSSDVVGGTSNATAEFSGFGPNDGSEPDDDLDL